PQQKIDYMQLYWKGQSQIRSWADESGNFMDNPYYDASRSWTGWTSQRDGAALAIFEPCTYDNAMDPNGASFSGSGFVVRFVPQPVIKAIFEKALANNRFLVPSYTRVVLSAHNDIMVGSPVSASDEGLLLGAAKQEFGKYS